MINALDRYLIEGVKTNKDFLSNILQNENFEKSSCLKQRDKSELIQKKFMSRVNSLGYLRMKYNFLPNVRFSKFISLLLHFILSYLLLKFFPFNTWG